MRDTTTMRFPAGFQGRFGGLSGPAFGALSYPPLAQGPLNPDPVPERVPIGRRREAHVSVAIVEAEHHDSIRHRIVSSGFEDGVPLGSVRGLDGS